MLRVKLDLERQYNSDGRGILGYIETIVSAPTFDMQYPYGDTGSLAPGTQLLVEDMDVAVIDPATGLPDSSAKGSGCVQGSAASGVPASVSGLAAASNLATFAYSKLPNSVPSATQAFNSVPLQVRAGPPSDNSSGWVYALALRALNATTVAVDLPPGAAQTATAVRYAWADVPCCPGINMSTYFCPAAACPLVTSEAKEPAVPFWAAIRWACADAVVSSRPHRARVLSQRRRRRCAGAGRPGSPRRRR
jgi:hypothetical protein